MGNIKYLRLLLGFSAGLGTVLGAKEPTHPSLFFTKAELPAIKQNIADSEWMSHAYRVLLNQADDMLEYGPEPYAYQSTMPSEYAHSEAGDWKKHGILGRILEKRVGTLGIAGHLSGDQRYIKRAIEIMIAAAKASDPDEWYGHLQQSDGARGYAIGYDLLYPYMTDQERSIAREEIEKVGAILHNYSGVWSRDEPVVNSQNHTSIHYGALGLCALALRDKPEWKKKATTRNRAYITHFIDDTGYGTEGVDYTNYGLLGVVPYRVALQRRDGIDLISENPQMALIPSQIAWAQFPWGHEVIAMNDNPTTLGSSAGLMYLISRYKHSEGLWAWLQIEGEAPGAGSYGGGRPSRRGDNRPSIGDGLSLPFVLLWGDSELEAQAPSALSHHYSSGRVFARDSWDDPLGSHLSFTSGIDFHPAHNHSDENAFTFCARGEEFALDPGRFPWTTRSHNAVLINDIGQIRGLGRGRILEFEERGNSVYMKGDAREGYARAPHFRDEAAAHEPPILELKTAERQILYVRGEQPYLLIVDNIETQDQAENDYAWLLHTATKNHISVSPNQSSARITGSRRGAVCDIHFLWPQENLRIEESDLQNARLPNQKKTSDNSRQLSRYFKELTAKTTARNPHFISLLVARESDTPAPTLNTKGDFLNMEVTIAFDNQNTDTIQVSPNGIALNRVSLQ